jgi:hypothetical protein
VFILFISARCIAGDLDWKGWGLAKGLMDLPLDLKADLSIETQHNSNVNSLPDGQTLASQKAGWHWVAGLNWSLGKKQDKNARRTQLWKGSWSKTDYVDDAFTTRQSEALTLGWSNQRKYGKSSRFLSATAKVQVRHDWLDAVNRRELGFRTYTVGEMFVLKPRAKQWGYDAVVPVLGVDLEYRDYVKALSLNTTGDSQDTFTPQILFLMLGMKKSPKGDDHRTTLMFLGRNSYASAPEQAYLDARFSLRHAIRHQDWDLDVGGGWNLRLQEEFPYLGVTESREDHKWQGSVSLTRFFEKDKTHVKLNFLYEDQSSDFISYTYDNRQVSLSMGHKL